MSELKRQLCLICLSLLATILSVVSHVALAQTLHSSHWLDVQQLAWTPPDQVKTVALVHSAKASLQDVIKLNHPVELTSFSKFTDVDLYVLTRINKSPSSLDIHHPAYSMAQWQGDWSASEAKQLLKGQVWLIGLDAKNNVSAATKIQHFRVLDALYTFAKNDADEAMLGPYYADDGSISARVWAPTAQKLELHIFDEDKQFLRKEMMSEDSHTGIWHFTDKDLDRLYYRFKITLFHPESDAVESYYVTDPYSVSVSVNSIYSQFIDLNAPELKPTDWDVYARPNILKPEDAIIYEGHIRDFSILDSSTPEQYRGKYKAFTLSHSDPVKHLVKLAASGITHFHMLPVNDIAMLNEDENETVGLFNTIGHLCELNTALALCSDTKRDAVIIDLLMEYAKNPASPKPQEIVNQLRDYDGFNWGYDPFHFNVPEGAYALEPDGPQRVLEFRHMIQAIHQAGLRVVMDVVFNHTHASGMHVKSVLDKIVPGYYHRLDAMTGTVLQHSCCPDTEDEARMMQKLMYDSLQLWSKEYHIDDFRFDLMGLHSKNTMVSLYTKMQQVSPDVFFYGEAWKMPERFVLQANQSNMSDTGIGMFNDRFRDAIRNGHFFFPNDKFTLAKSNIEIGLAGSIKALGGFVNDPQEVINYVSKHDDHTLWDQLQRVLPDDFSSGERVRIHNMSLALPLVAQGVPFLQMGGELMRSKSLDRNSFDASDWFNRVDFTMQTNNWGVGLPLSFENKNEWASITKKLNDTKSKVSPQQIQFAYDVFSEFVKIRRSTPLFRLATANDIEQNVTFITPHDNESNSIIIMQITDGLGEKDIDSKINSVLIVVNGLRESRIYKTELAQDYQLHPVQAESIDQMARRASYHLMIGENEKRYSEIFIPAQTIGVFIEKQL